MGKFQVGHPGYKKKGTKHKATLLQEERRAIFEARSSQKWEETIDKLPPVYVADQFMGKAADVHKVVVVTEPSDKIKELAKHLLVLQSKHEEGTKNE